MSHFVESVVRTNKLHCSDCESKIKVGDEVVFELSDNTGRMKNVYCEDCKSNIRSRGLC